MQHKNVSFIYHFVFALRLFLCSIPICRLRFLSEHSDVLRVRLVAVFFALTLKLLFLGAVRVRTLLGLVSTYYRSFNN